MARTIFEGGCHCGNLTYVFEASRPLEELGLRACQCAFCRAHGARNASDPNGAMQIRVRDGAQMERYRFALRTADFLICKVCGVYIGALLPDGDKGWFTVNVNTFRDPPPPDFPLEPIVYDAENAKDRVGRRETKWTPVEAFAIG
jgi:hypothetical protein